jgi:hypothetical protein
VASLKEDVGGAAHQPLRYTGCVCADGEINAAIHRGLGINHLRRLEIGCLCRNSHFIFIYLSIISPFTNVTFVQTQKNGLLISEFFCI